MAVNDTERLSFWMDIDAAVVSVPLELTLALRECVVLGDCN
jgi:hypothetical protein